MATDRAHTLPSDPDYLLSLLSELEDESDSDDDFKGWLKLDDDPEEPCEECADSLASPSAIL